MSAIPRAERLRIREEINALLDTFYTRDEKLQWWDSGQPLFDNKLPYDLIDEGQGEEVLRILRCMDEGAYI